VLLVRRDLAANGGHGQAYASAIRTFLDKPNGMLTGFCGIDPAVIDEFNLQTMCAVSGLESEAGGNEIHVYIPQCV
jgi:hypothetical protein